MSVFPCVARGFKARASVMFAACRWWQSLAADGGSGTFRGHHAVGLRPTAKNQRWLGGGWRPRVLYDSVAITL